MDQEVIVKKDYEIAYLLKTEAAAQDLAKLLRQHEADIKFDGGLKRTTLSYKIKKETEAYFGFVQFQMEPLQVKALEQNLRVFPAVLRSFIATLPKIKAKDARVGARPRLELRPKPATEVKPAETLSNEALEKKIEEILQ